jgi:hypothetical protein
MLRLCPSKDSYMLPAIPLEYFGVSLSHAPLISSGVLGCVVRDEG